MIQGIILPYLNNRNRISSLTPNRSYFCHLQSKISFSGLIPYSIQKPTTEMKDST